MILEEACFLYSALSMTDSIQTPPLPDYPAVLVRKLGDY
jgi:hypothetical protein